MKLIIHLLPLVSLITATPLRIEKLVAGRDVTVTEKDVENLKFYAEYAGAAYCNSDSPNGSPVTCSNDVCPTVMSDNATVWATLDGNTSTNTEGFVAIDPARSLIVVSLRGTQTIRNWLTDFFFPQIPCTYTAGCLVHAGFLIAWTQVRPALLAAVASAAATYPSYQVVVAGHSLGGAVGHLAAAELRSAGIPADLYTYGSPRVGNLALASLLTQQPGAEFRVTHAADPVPRLPPLVFNYRHTSPEYWLYADGDGDATPADVKVCEGAASVRCNAGARGFDIEAHGEYFGAIAACAADRKEFKRRGQQLSDEEVEAKVDSYAVLDWEFAAALEAAGGE